MQPYEQLGLFYLGKRYDLSTRRRAADPVLYDSRDLLTHAVCVGMTGSGKTGLGIVVIEEAALDGIPVLAIDPKGDLANLLLTFPNLTAAELEPWINPGDAARSGLTPKAFAAQQAEAWRTGLGEWDQDAERIARLRAAAEVRAYTPGSRAGTPLALLRTLPPLGHHSAHRQGNTAGGDEEEVASRIAATTQSILALAGLPDSSPQGRERVLVATLLQHAARSVQPVDLGWLVQQVQKPPFDRIGILDVETFYPARNRQELRRSAASPDQLPTASIHVARTNASRPVVPAGVREFFIPGTAAMYEARLYASARVRYTDAKRGIDMDEDVNVVVPFGQAAIDVSWDRAVGSAVAPDALLPTPPNPDATYAALPTAAADPRSYPAWERDFERWISHSRPLSLFSAPRLKLSSKPGETERDFRIRVQQARKEERDATWNDYERSTVCGCSALPIASRRHRPPPRKNVSRSPSRSCRPDCR